MMHKINSIFRMRRGQTTTEVVLLLPVFIIFLVFIVKIFGLLVLNQKMQIAGYYVARRYQLQSHTTDYYHRTWDKRFLIKDLKRKVEEYLGFNNAATKRFLSLNQVVLNVDSSGTWVKITLTARTKPMRIPFLCNYNKDQVCDRDHRCLVGYAFLCETGQEMTVNKYVGHNERPAPFVRPEGK